jgi:hypothetical protein
MTSKKLTERRTNVKKKNKQRKRQRPDTGQAVPVSGWPKLTRPKKEPPSELEVIAKEVVKLNVWIERSRRDIRNIEDSHRQALKNERETLANYISEHRTKLARMEELSQMPQVS